MTPLGQYYIRKAGVGGEPGHSGIGPIYSVPPFVQRGHCMAVFSAGYGGPCDPYCGAVPSRSDAKRCALAEIL